MHNGDDTPAISISTNTVALLAAGGLALGGIFWWWPLLLAAIGLVWTNYITLPLVWRISLSCVLAIFLVPMITLAASGKLFLFPPGCSDPAVIQQLRQLVPESTGFRDIGPLLQFSAIRTVGQNPTTCRADVDFSNTGTISGLWGVQPARYQIGTLDNGEYYIELWFE